MVTDPIYLKNWELFLDPTSKLSTLLWISNVQISNYVFSFYRVTDSTYLFKNYLYKRPARAAETNEIQVLQRSGICKDFPLEAAPNKATIYYSSLTT